MPQNEFNSAQWYPSCTCTPGELSKILKFLGRKWQVNLDSNTDNLLAFKNPDNSIVVVIYNPDAAIKAITLTSGKTVLNPILKSKSFNTFLIK